ncbi:hypothetical protein [Crateriforma conspicua]|uniref:hypothetical protein n=1 Tax=Crateriforma conspicua TaxID=2527996 RepID=UPI0011AAE4EC|nr:hypothetical protein [Crateriforma conspicua]
MSIPLIAATIGSPNSKKRTVPCWISGGAAIDCKKPPMIGVKRMADSANAAQEQLKAVPATIAHSVAVDRSSLMFYLPFKANKYIGKFSCLKIGWKQESTGR